VAPVLIPPEPDPIPDPPPVCLHLRNNDTFLPHMSPYLHQLQTIPLNRPLHQNPYTDNLVSTYMRTKNSWPLWEGHGSLKPCSTPLISLPLSSTYLTQRLQRYTAWRVMGFPPCPPLHPGHLDNAYKLYAAVHIHLLHIILGPSFTKTSLTWLPKVTGLFCHTTLCAT